VNVSPVEHEHASLRRRPLKIAVALSDAENAAWLQRLQLLGHRAVAVELRRLAAALSDPELDLVVCRLDGAMRGLRELLRVPALLHVGTLSSDLVSAVANYARVAAAEDLEQACARLEELAAPERRQHRFKPVCDIAVQTADGRSAWRLNDVSNEGLSFTVPFGSGIDSFTRDAVLPPLNLLHDGPHRRQPVLTAPAARVRNLSACDDGYRVGCRLLKHRELDSGRYSVDLEGVVALLLGPEGGRKVTVREIDGGATAAFGSIVRVDQREGTLEVQVDGPSPKVHELVECQFDAMGVTHAFSSVVLENRPLKLKLPRSLRQIHRRAALRLDARHEVKLTLDHPLTGEAMTLAVADISGRGLSFDFDAQAACFPQGLKLPAVILTLGDTVVSTSAEVRALRPLGAKTLRCGVSFVDLDADNETRLGTFWIRLGLPAEALDARAEFSELWDFFRQTHFLSAAAAGQLAPSLPVIAETFDHLSRENSPVAQSTTVRDAKGIVAHVEAVMRFRRTWFIQHLAARARSGRLALLLNRALAEFVEQRPSIGFARLTYFAANRWPARILGRYARRIEAHDFSVVQQRHIVVVPTAFAVQRPLGSKVEAHLADTAELLWVERFFTRVEPSLLWQANDLTAPHLELAEVDAAYRRVGLTRSRKVLVACRAHEPAAVALAEVSSPGINLREDFSGLRIFFSPGLSPEDCLAVTAALLDEALSLYQAKGRAAVRLFAEAAQLPLLERLALRPEAEIREWTFRREAVPPFVEYISQMLRHIERE
jgi:hypothetical protein